MVAAAAVLALLAGCGHTGDDRTSATTSVVRRGTSSTSAPPTSVATTAVASPSSASVPSAPTGVLVVAHRGASGYAPEHTFAAYDLAVEKGADYLEQDLQLTADGVLVVLHDATLDRTARGPAESCTGLVEDKTLAQLKQCDVGSWFNEAHPELANPAFVGQRIPTLQEVLDRYGARARYYIELKAVDAGSAMVDPLLDLLERAALPEATTGAPPVFVQSFGPGVLTAVHARRPDLPLVLLVADTGAAVDEATLDGADDYAVAIGPPAAGVDRALVDAAHGRCLAVHPYTVDDPTEMVRLLDAGVDGMFTDVPDVLRIKLAPRPAPPAPCPEWPGG